jgi:hypothetical protein
MNRRSFLWQGLCSSLPFIFTPFPLRRDGMAFDVLSNTAQTAADSFPENEWYLSILVKGRLHPDGAGHRTITE